MKPSVLLAGASGLVGNTVLDLLLDDSRYERVIVLVRRPLDVEHPKLEQWVATNDELLSGLRQEPVGAVICCLGTTIRNAGGDRAKFMHVDQHLVIDLGRWAKNNGVSVFCVISSVGADPASSMFYGRVKGEMEAGLRSLELPRLHIFQPSILTGPRKEFRLGERIGILFSKLFAPLFPDRFKPMPHKVLAKALVNAINLPEGGTYHYRRIAAIAEAQKSTARP